MWQYVGYMLKYIEICRDMREMSGNKWNYGGDIS